MVVCHLPAHVFAVCLLKHMYNSNVHTSLKKSKHIYFKELVTITHSFLEKLLKMHISLIVTEIEMAGRIGPKLLLLINLAF